MVNNFERLVCLLITQSPISALFLNFLVFNLISNFTTSLLGLVLEPKSQLSLTSISV